MTAGPDDRNHRMLLLSEMSLRCNLAADEREVYEVAAAYMPRVMGSDYAGVSFVVAGADEAAVMMFSATPDAMPVLARLYVPGTSFEETMRGDRTVVQNRVVDGAELPPSLQQLSIRSIMHAPLREGRRAIGTLHVSSRTPDAFDDNDASLLTQIAALVSATITRVRTHSEMLLARAAAEEASRAKSEYLAHLSHEIRTPLNGVIGMISLLQQTTLNAEQLEYVTTIRASGEALLSIVNDVLDFSKIEAQQIELEDRPFEVRHLVRDSMNIVSAQARQRGLRLAADVDTDVPRYCRGDAFRVQQILVNLLSNAVKFTRQGHVRVTVALEGPPDDDQTLALRFRVEDTGMGIPPDRVDRLFRPFSQAAVSYTHLTLPTICSV